jgi:hypothetical protein
MIQEPYFDYKKDSHVSSKWITIYPLNHINNPLHTRSMILVNAKISSSSWTAFSIGSLNIAIIQITGNWSILQVFNIYNDQAHSHNLTTLNHYLLTLKLEQCHSDTPVPNDIWLSDFNQHSPTWDKAHNSQLFTHPALCEAQHLIDLAVMWNMHMALHAGINTLKYISSKNYTCPDNVWASDKLHLNIPFCDALLIIRINV